MNNEKSLSRALTKLTRFKARKNVLTTYYFSVERVLTISSISFLAHFCQLRIYA